MRQREVPDSVRLRGFMLIGLAGWTAPAGAQWTVVSLHPAGAVQSQAWSIHEGVQAGEANFAGTGAVDRRAAVWAGTAGSFLNLHPSGATFSYLLSTRGGQHVGAALVSGFSQASLWTGNSSSSWISLHPAGADFSVGMGGGAEQQVGRARWGPGTTIKGILWQGSAASYVDLHPTGLAEETWAIGSDGVQQVGSAAVAGTGRSSLWMGTAASWMDMTPPFAIASRLESVHAGRQAGMIVVNDQVHAAVWSNTPSSAVDLNPAGTTDSWAYGVYADRQVGYATFGGQRRAAYWTGTAGSFANLHDVLPAGMFVSSEARGVWVNASGATYVVGWARVASPAHNEAIMWVLPGACYANCDGSTGTPVLNVNDFVCFQARFAAGAPYADCDQSGGLNVNDFVCFQSAFAAGCR